QHRVGSHSRKKKKGLFNFGNSSSSSGLSSDHDLAYGMGFARRRPSNSSLGTTRRKSAKHKNSDEKLKATLVGLGATTAALAAAKHHHNRRDKRGRRTPELVSGHHHVDPYLGSHRRKDEEDGEWENVSDAESVSTVGSSSSSLSSGLAFGN